MDILILEANTHLNSSLLYLLKNKFRGKKSSVAIKFYHNLVKQNTRALVLSSH